MEVLIGVGQFKVFSTANQFSHFVLKNVEIEFLNCVVLRKEL